MKLYLESLTFKGKTIPYPKIDENSVLGREFQYILYGGDIIYKKPEFDKVPCQIYYYDGDDLLKTISVRFGTDIIHPGCEPEKEGSIFLGWSLKKDDTTALSELTANRKEIILYTVYSISNFITADNYRFVTADNKILLVKEGD